MLDWIYIEVYCCYRNLDQMYFRSNGSKGLCYTNPDRHCCFCKNLLNSSSSEFDVYAVKHLAITAKQYLYRQGDMNHELFVLREGWVMLTRLSYDGKRQVFRSVLPGELLGFQQHLHGPAIYSAIALLDSIVCRVPNIVRVCSYTARIWSKSCFGGSL